jgi:hypothetical protein
MITSGEQPIPNLDLPATSRPAMADLQANNPDGRPSPPVTAKPEIVVEDDNLLSHTR